MTDHELLTILHSRIENGGVKLQIQQQGDGFARVHVVAGVWGFEAMAYVPTTREL